MSQFVPHFAEGAAFAFGTTLPFLLSRSRWLSLAADLHVGGMVHQPVEHRRGQYSVTGKRLIPTAKRPNARVEVSTIEPLMAFGNHLEQQVCLIARQRDNGKSPFSSMTS